MEADGSNLQRLTDRPAVDGVPAWSPDGRNVVNLTEGIDGGALGGEWVLASDIASLVQSLSWGGVKELSR